MTAVSLFVQRRLCLVPRGDCGEILVRGTISFGVLKLHGTIGPCLHVSLADFVPSAQQICGLLAFVGHEHDVHLLQCVDGLHGDVVGIAGPDPDELQFSHAELARGNGEHAFRMCWRVRTISPMTTRAGAARFAACDSAAMRSRLDTSTCCCGRGAEAMTAAGVLAGRPPRINASVTAPILRSPM